MTKIPDVFDRMMALLDKNTIAEMWEDWCSIADEIIPSNFDIGDAVEVALSPTSQEREIDEDYIRDRVEYLSDRADPARIYWLDWSIRYYLEKTPRDEDKLNNSITKSRNEQ